MPLSPSFWACLALLVLTAMLCRRWPALALYGATSAFCAVGQAWLHPLAPEPLVIFADSILFVLPTVVLVRACGMSEEASIVVGAFVPLAMGVDYKLGYEIRSALLVLGIGAAQGFAAVFALRNELRAKEKSTGIWIAIIIAATGVLGLAFSEVWSDVAWTGVAAHAFACLAYFADEKRE